MTQRVELIEEKITDLEGKILEMVSKAVERAVDAIHHSLSEMLLEGQTKATKGLIWMLWRDDWKDEYRELVSTMSH